MPVPLQYLIYINGCRFRGRPAVSRDPGTYNCIRFHPFLFCSHQPIIWKSMPKSRDEQKRKKKFSTYEIHKRARFGGSPGENDRWFNILLTFFCSLFFQVSYMSQNIIFSSQLLLLRFFDVLLTFNREASKAKALNICPAYIS